MKHNEAAFITKVFSSATRINIPLHNLRVSRHRLRLQSLNGYDEDWPIKKILINF